MKILLAICIVILLLAPLQSAHASLVVCGQSRDDVSTPNIDEHQECTPCLILVQIKRVIDFITLELVPIVAFLLIVIAGFMIVIGGASPETIGTGKKMLTNTVIGVVIIYLSWLAANTVIKAVAGDNDVATSWFQLKCDDTKATAGTGGTGGGIFQGSGGRFGGGGASGTYGMTDAEARAALLTQGINPNGLPACDPKLMQQPKCGYYGGVQPNSVQELIAFKKACPTCEITVNDATGPGHTGPTHGAGDAFDIQHSSSLDPYVSSLPLDPAHPNDSRYHVDGQGMVWFNENTAHWHVTAH